MVVLGHTVQPNSSRPHARMFSGELPWDIPHQASRQADGQADRQTDKLAGQRHLDSRPNSAELGQNRVRLRMQMLIHQRGHDKGCPIVAARARNNTHNAHSLADGYNLERSTFICRLRSDLLDACRDTEPFQPVESRLLNSSRQSRPR